MFESVVTSPDSPVYGAHREQDTFEIETRDALYSGTSLQCFEFTGRTKDELLQTLQKLTGADVFPGPQPMSIDRSMFDAFRHDVFWVSKKTDGVRGAMMIINLHGHNIVAVFDRTLDRVFGFFIQNVPKPLYQNTIFDGEIVKNTIENTWTFLIFDAFVVAGIPQFHKQFPERLHAAWASLQSYTYSPHDTVSLELKTFVPLHECTDSAISDPRFADDGYVFMPQSKEYVFGHHTTFFKLKQHHTVDLKVDGRALLAYNTETRRHVKACVLKEPASFEKGTIVECVLHEPNAIASKRVWRAILERRDKSRANSVFVVDKTLLNITENLQFQDVKNIVSSQKSK